MRLMRWMVAAVVLGGTAWAADLMAQDPAPNLTGAWAFSVVTDNGTGTPDVTFLQEDEALTGTYTSPRMGLRRLEGTVRGDSIQFRLETDPEAGVVMTFVGSVQADGSLAGIVDFGGMGGATFTARRRPASPPPGWQARGVIFLGHSGVTSVHAPLSSAWDPRNPSGDAPSLLADSAMAHPASVARTRTDRLHEGAPAGGARGRA